MNLSDAEKHIGHAVTVTNQGESLPAVIIGVPAGTDHVRVQTLVPDADGHEVVGQVLDVPPTSVDLVKDAESDDEKPAAKKAPAKKASK